MPFSSTIDGAFSPFQAHEGLDQHTALGVRHGDDAGFGNLRVAVQRGFDFAELDAIAAALDHAVAAAVEQEVAGRRPR